MLRFETEYHILFCSSVEEEDDLTYDEVGLYQPDPHHKRPIVLVGPPHVGRQDLKQKLLEGDRRFKAPVPRELHHLKTWL